MTANVARADEDGSSASQLYDEGKRAYDAGDYATAGKLLSRADNVAPNAAVIDLAMAAARKADDPILGMELVERAEKRGLASTARAGRDVFASRVGLLSISCPGSTRCEARVDGNPWGGQQSRWLLAGEHAVLLESDGNAEHFSVHVEGAKTMVVRPTRIVQILPPAPPALPIAAANDRDTTPSPKRISSAWFWGGVVTTAALGAATTVSGLDTLSKKDDFRANPYDDGLASSGSAAETRTNVLLVSTIVAAAATSALAYFAWRPQRNGR